MSVAASAAVTSFLVLPFPASLHFVCMLLLSTALVVLAAVLGHWQTQHEKQQQQHGGVAELGLFGSAAADMTPIRGSTLRMAGQLGTAVVVCWMGLAWWYFDPTDPRVRALGGTQAILKDIATRDRVWRG